MEGDLEKAAALRAKLHAKWAREIKAAQRYFQDWYARADKVVEKYADKRTDTSDGRLGDGTKFNILWSNVQTLRPALYAKRPVPEVVRRHRDSDPVGRTAAEILERAVSFAVDDTAYNETMTCVVTDRLLPGRGVAWVRYCPHYGEEVTPRLDVMQGDDGSYTDEDGSPVEPAKVQASPDGKLFVSGEPYTPVEWEDVEPDYVHWKDFLHAPAPTWEHVRWVAKRVRMSRSQLRERFGDVADKIPLNAKGHGADQKSIEDNKEQFGRADVWEIWDKDGREAIWINLDYAERVLDQMDDPLRLQGFFPCPRPIFATVTTDSLIPVPDFCYYQDQARQLDEITLRIDLLTQAMRVAGAYDSSEHALTRLIQDEGENILVPVDRWAAFAEKGGLQGAISFLPIKDVAEVLQMLVQVREQIKQDLYEITGISDIVRGQTQASETATAQRLKGQFATLRLRELQDEVQRFARDVIALMAEVIAEHFEPQTLLEMSGYQQMAGANPQLFMQAVQLLKDEKMRSFRVDIETDSTIQPDEDAEKQSRVEFLTASTTFLEKAIPAVQMVPESGPLMFELLMFGVRAFKTGRQLEGAFEEFQQRMAQRMQQQAQQPPQPSPEQIKAEIEKQKADVLLQVKNVELQIEQTRTAMEERRAEREHMAELQRSDAKAQSDIRIAETKAVADIEISREKAENDMAIQAQKAEQDAALKVQGAVVQAEIARSKTEQQPRGEQ